MRGRNYSLCIVLRTEATIPGGLSANLPLENRFIENGCGAVQGCRGRILERLYIDNCLPLTVELFRQLVFFILSCKPISYCRFKRIDVYIL